MEDMVAKCRSEDYTADRKRKTSKDAGVTLIKWKLRRQS
jgi:hypothetical protein